mgnify:CR=1 FL=1
MSNRRPFPYLGHIGRKCAELKRQAANLSLIVLKCRGKFQVKTISPIFLGWLITDFL